jgi:hypothetical protein
VPLSHWWRILSSEARSARRRQNKCSKGCTRAKLLQRETQFFLEPDKVTPKVAKTLSEAMAASTKKETSDARQRMRQRRQPSSQRIAHDFFGITDRKPQP